MLTEDLQLPTDGDWLVIPLISAYTVVANTSHWDVLVRTGASSSSNGFTISPNEKAIFDETIYIRASVLTDNLPKITVMR